MTLAIIASMLFGVVVGFGLSFLAMCQIVSKAAVGMMKELGLTPTKPGE